ncbi:MAG TPA: amino acid adenylation domain-containing protein [Blastocatellia bacterium]|nr:amino acid adenylation domain-containing protein [Blastocatellia bacterium]
MYNVEVSEASGSFEIAVIGLTGRFPGAESVDQFWRNLCDGIEGISFFTGEEIEASGISPEVAQDPSYVRASGTLRDVDLFDASFFGFYPREAEILDPQQRIFLECAWSALENAGYDPATYSGLIGVYAGTGFNTYLHTNLLASRAIRESIQPYQLTINSDKDFLPTRVCYKLNLRGPGVNVQSACSTSLVAIHLACQSLLNYQCDMALAGGVSLYLRKGYQYQEGGILSPDGHCRAFDASAQGTVPGSGAGIVVLKRLTDALADGDCIYAVIKGSAINNDGSLKVGFTAPGVEGQAEVIAMAQAMAGVSPETISYVEAHGTGTALGDPIEIAALTQAFSLGTQEKNFCAIGSAKTSVGHLDAAAGVTGFIKTVLALNHGLIPPSLHFERPNPKIDFANSPFYVNASLTKWETDGEPRRAGVSSFGIGGTNAHVILEEAPVREESSDSRPAQLLLLSARTASALEAATQNLAEHLKQHPDLNLADAAFTLQAGRQPFAHRRMLVCRETSEAIAALEGRTPGRVLTAQVPQNARSVVMMFTGQGAQYVNMARELYETEPTFRDQVDLCADLLAPRLGLDLRTVLFPEAGQEAEMTEHLNQTWLTQPALFVIEYALARLWMQWGVKPAAMIGHSIGEYVAACLAEVFSLEDALALVAARGRLMQSLPAGSMLSLPVSEKEVRPFLNGKLSVAAINAPSLCVVSGPTEAVEELERRLADRGIEGRRLHTSHAFHSAMMEPILEPFARQLSRLTLNVPRIPFISNLSGTWITTEEATSPNYWARHLRYGVRFADGIGELLSDTSRIFLEIGPGTTLSSLVRQHSAYTREHVVLSSLRHPHDQQSDVAFLINSLGRLWLSGFRPDWQGFYAHERRHRIPLPTYPFERKRYWIEPDRESADFSDARKELRKRSDVRTWFYAPSWKRADLIVAQADEALAAQKGCWLVFGDETGLSAQLAQRLEDSGQEVVRAHVGSEFFRSGNRFTLNPQASDHYLALLRELDASALRPATIVHAWGASTEALTDAAHSAGFESLLRLTQALGQSGFTSPLRLEVITAGAQEVTGEESLAPASALMNGLCRVIPQEYSNLTCRSIDLTVSEFSAAIPNSGLIERLVAELTTEASDAVIAYRGCHRWVQTFEPLRPVPEKARLREGGVYLITGGLGRIGLTLADYLARAAHAKLVLVGRTEMPAKEQWSQWLGSHDADDRISRLIGRLQALEEAGATVLTLSADVTSRAQMQAVVAEAEAAFGALNGVIHAAGLTGDEAITPIQELDERSIERQFAPKVQGVLALAEVLRGRKLDFCILQSSLSALLGGLGFAAYAAANAFLDSFALRQRRVEATPWLSLNWDGWKFGEEPGAFAGMTTADLALTAAEGVQAFECALSIGQTAQAAISTGDLNLRLDQWVRRTQAEEEEPEEEAEASSHARPSLETAYVAPRNEVERQIAAMWRQVLGIEEIGIHDSFFELGGHSLLATQLVGRVREAFQVRLPLRRLFETPTIAGLSALIAAENAESVPQPAATIPVIPRDGALPLSFVQQRLWFLDQFDPGSPLYNNPAAVRLTGQLDVEAMERSLNALIARHEVLRTVFTTDKGEPVQTILPELRLTVAVTDLTRVPEALRETEVQRLAAEEAVRPFDLAHGPLIRFSLLRTGEDEHVALLTMHHIVSDGWSVGVFITELSAFYTAFVRGDEAHLPELPIQYADFAHWQRERLRGDELQRQIDYWKQKLGDGSVILELPTDRPRPPVQTYRGATQWVKLPGELRDQLDALSRREEATLFMTLMAAFQSLLHRYTGQSDIRVGSPIAGRTQTETERLIGCFINPLVMRAEISDGISFRELLRQVRETALEAYAHQDLPFEMLVEALQPERDMSRSPLFQAMLVLQNAPVQPLELPGLTISEMKPDRGTEKFDLTLFVEEEADGLKLGWSYNTDLFDDATITRMAGHFRVLLEGIISDPGRRVAHLPLMTEAECRQVLLEWNDTSTGEPPALLVHRSFEAQVAQTPEAVAVLCGERELTYRELNERANRLARYLRGLGVGPETIVAACPERSPEAIVALLGVLKAGGAWLPLDPQAPAERNALILADAGARVLLTHERFKSSISDVRSGIHVFSLDADWPLIEEQSADNLNIEVTGDQLAYVIYTSGSTGRPKGVMVTQQTLADHIRDARRHYLIEASDRVLQFAAFTFDPSLEQTFTALTCGASLHLREGEALTAAEFNQLVAERGLTVVNIPPAWWQQWIQEWRQNARLAVPEQLRLVIVGGDALKPETLREWQQTPLKNARLLNAYGPTETTVTATTFEVPPDFNAATLPHTPIGRPLPNRRLCVLDRHLQPVPVGVPGELYIGGAGVARGYLNRPELTAEKFIEWSVVSGQWSVATDYGQRTTDNGQRLYRTGDLVRWLADGNLEFLGRVDFQVKIRGFRIEPGEVEAALCAHPAVREAVVQACEAKSGGKQLVAYVTAQPGAALTPAKLSGFLKTKLPDYMVPAAFVLLDAMPLTSGGKIDRRALPAPEAATASSDYVAPRTPLEEEIARIWRQVLQTERIGIHDNFFEIGGHSLLATQIISQLREQFCVELPLRRLFEAPTIEGTARLIAEQQAASASEDEMAALLAELESMSEEEVRKMLAHE